MTPGQPHTPEVNTITKTTMLVEWNKPAMDGGSMVTGYYLERRDKKSLRWIRVYKEAIADIKKMVYHLTEGNQYQYRVCAINRAGEGPFSEVSDNYKAADPVGECSQMCFYWGVFIRKALCYELSKHMCPALQKLRMSLAS